MFVVYCSELSMPPLLDLYAAYIFLSYLLFICIIVKYIFIPFNSPGWAPRNGVSAPSI